VKRTDKFPDTQLRGNFRLTIQKLSDFAQAACPIQIDDVQLLLGHRA
jgi:hypothetical protein